MNDLSLGRTGTQSLFRHMGFVRRFATTGKLELSEGVKREAELLYINDIMNLIETHNIPKSMVLNLHQTPLKCVPCRNTTHAQKSSSAVSIDGVSDKRIITEKFTNSFDGQLTIFLYNFFKISICHHTLFMLHYFHVALFLLPLFHLSLFLMYTFLMLHSFHVVLFSCCTLFKLHFFHVKIFSCCTISMLHFFSVSRLFYFSLFLSLFMFSHVALFPCCTFFVLHSFQVALFSC